VLEAQLVTPERPHSATIVNELNVLEKRGRLIFHAIKLSTASALLGVLRYSSFVRELTIALFDSSNCECPLYCDDAHVNCQFDLFPSRSLLRNRDFRGRFFLCGEGRGKRSPHAGGTGPEVGRFPELRQFATSDNVLW